MEPRSVNQVRLDNQSLNERLALKLRNRASDLDRGLLINLGALAAELREIAAQVEYDLPSAYHKHDSRVHLGDVCEVSTQLAITPAIPTDAHCQAEPSGISSPTSKE